MYLHIETKNSNTRRRLQETQHNQTWWQEL